MMRSDMVARSENLRVTALIIVSVIVIFSIEDLVMARLNEGSVIVMVSVKLFVCATEVV